MYSITAQASGVKSLKIQNDPLPISVTTLFLSKMCIRTRTDSLRRRGEKKAQAAIQQIKTGEMQEKDLMTSLKSNAPSETIGF